MVCSQPALPRSGTWAHHRAHGPQEGQPVCLGRRNAPLQKDNAFIETGALQNMDGALDLMGVF